MKKTKAKRRGAPRKPQRLHSVRVNVSLSPADAKWLRGWADQQGVSYGALIVEAMGALENHWVAWLGKP
jgi:hypothetical protein